MCTLPRVTSVGEAAVARVLGPVLCDDPEGAVGVGGRLKREGINVSI